MWYPWQTNSGPTPPALSGTQNASTHGNQSSHNCRSDLSGSLSETEYALSSKVCPNTDPSPHTPLLSPSWTAKHLSSCPFTHSHFTSFSSRVIMSLQNSGPWTWRPGGSGEVGAGRTFRHGVCVFPLSFVSDSYCVSQASSEKQNQEGM